MTQDDINAIAARVISIEADAMHQMARDLPSDFADAVEAILQTKGRVIVSGVGKSGHIGNKIAATLASTGTPASFVHATEASHGDLGMVTAADFCLLISNSGETSELRDIVAHTRRFGIPMAAISSKPNSTLMRAADYKLTLTQAPEACSIGMAPTTSTTLTLAFGDALAVALMERRDFQPEDFKVFHPGGKLGAQMATVAQLMHRGVWHCRCDPRGCIIRRDHRWRFAPSYGHVDAGNGGEYCGAKPRDSHPRYVRSRGVEHHEHEKNQCVIGG